MRSTMSLTKINGNGQHDTGVVAWQENLRQAMYDAVTPGDVKEIVAGLVTRAKAGDAKAIQMVFDYVLAAKSQIKIENSQVVIGRPKGRKKTAALQGTSEKLDVMRDRARNGQALFHSRDGIEN